MKYLNFFQDPNSTAIDDMIMLVNKYGMSHVCAKQELHARESYDYPYLDISWTYIFKSDYGVFHKYIEFYFRGALDRNSSLTNLFEYLLLTSWNG